VKEKEFLKRVLNEKLADKELIRRRVLTYAENEGQTVKGAFAVRKKLVIAAVSACFVVALSFGVYAAADAVEYGRAEAFLGEIGVKARDLPRADAKELYRDMKSGSFELPMTMEILEKRAGDLGVEYVPQDSEQIYRALKNYSSLTYTGRVTSDKVETLGAGLSYGEIIDILGATKDVGDDTHMLQYLVDGSKLLVLTFGDESDICPYSGEEMLSTLKRVETRNNSDFAFDAVVVEVGGGRLFVDCPAYGKFDSASVGLSETAEIVFAGGGKASLADIAKGAEVIITYDGMIRESYPVQITATKIVIK